MSPRTKHSGARISAEEVRSIAERCRCFLEVRAEGSRSGGKGPAPEPAGRAQVLASRERRQAPACSRPPPVAHRSRTDSGPSGPGGGVGHSAGLGLRSRGCQDPSRSARSPQRLRRCLEPKPGSTDDMERTLRRGRRPQRKGLSHDRRAFRFMTLCNHRPGRHARTNAQTNGTHAHGVEFVDDSRTLGSAWASNRPSATGSALSPGVQRRFPRSRLLFARATRGAAPKEPEGRPLD